MTSVYMCLRHSCDLIFQVTLCGLHQVTTVATTVLENTTNFPNATRWPSVHQAEPRDQKDQVTTAVQNQLTLCHPELHAVWSQSSVTNITSDSIQSLKPPLNCSRAFSQGCILHTSSYSDSLISLPKISHNSSIYYLSSLHYDKETNQ